ncbi:MAG: hypothetical protein WB611_20010 [Stellaceae bacterium]
MRNDFGFVAQQLSERIDSLASQLLPAGLLCKVICRFEELGHPVRLWKRIKNIKDYNDFARWLQSYKPRIPMGDQIGDQA